MQQAKQPELTPADDKTAGKGQTQQAESKTPPPASTALAQKRFKEETFDKVMAQITAFQEAGDLKIPSSYVPQNALRAAWLILQGVEDRSGHKALEVCKPESICNSLLKMVVWGLNPLKKQCDFIVYGNELSCDPEYTGNIVLAKRYGKLKDYKARAIFKGDAFEFEVSGEFPYRTRIIKHEQKLENIGGEVIGAYFAYELTTGEKDVEIMNINQIRQAWGQGGSKGGSPAHKNFSDQMAIKTVINRGCKLLIRGSDDSALMLDDDDTPKPDADLAAANQKKTEGKEKTRDIDFEDAELVDDEKPDQKKKTAKDPVKEQKQQAAGENVPEMKF